MKKHIVQLMVAMVLTGISLMSFGEELGAKTVQIKDFGNDKPIPIAIVPFAWSGGALPQDVSKIVNDDLSHSGEFEVMPVANMLSKPHSLGEVNFNDWTMMKIDYIVVGSITASGGKYTAQYELIDVLKKQTIYAGTVSASADGLRKASHKISDRIYETITGVKGVFSTKMLYVEVQKLSGRKKAYRLYYADIDGYSPRVLLEKYEPIMSPTWSPDAKKAAYVRFENRHPGIFMVDIATGREERLTKFKGINSAPSWSPDGSRMAMSLSKDGNPEIYIMNIASRSLTRVTNNYGIDTEPSWMPDGRSLVFTSSRGGKPQIYQLDLASQAVTRLTFEGIYNAGAEVGVQGDRMVFVQQEADGDFHIAVKNLTTGATNALSRDSALDESPSVSPNGNMVLYATLSGGRGVLSVTSIKGRSTYVIPSIRGEIKHPAWSPYID
jgi:TolB protein